MYNKGTQDLIAGALGLKAEEFATGWASETEAELTLPEGRFLTTTEEATLKDNHGKARYDAGAEAAREMQLKDMSKLVGFGESVKEPQKFIDTYKKNILKQAQIEPNKKVAELEESLETLRNTVVDKDKDFATLEGKVLHMQSRTDLMHKMPKLSDMGLKTDEVLDLFLNTHEVKDGSVYKNGHILKDNLEKDLGVEDVLKGFVKERGWDFQEGKPPIGRRKTTKTGTGGVTFEDYEAEIAEKGFHPGGAEAQALLNTYAKENPEILN